MTMRGVLVTAMLLNASAGSATEAPPLQLEAKIPLGDVAGRIDHMAADVKRQRLFVAELGNDTVGVVDLVERKLLRQLTGLKEPQGVGYEPIRDTAAQLTAIGDMQSFAEKPMAAGRSWSAQPAVAGSGDRLAAAGTSRGRTVFR